MFVLKTERFWKLSRKADINSAGYGLPPQFLHPLYKNSHLKQYITLSSVWYCQREKHKLNLGLQIMVVHQ